MPKNTLSVLHKPTATIQISNPFSLYERKLLNTFMFYAQENGRISSNEQDIPLSKVLEAVGWRDSRNLAHLKDCMRSLLSTIIEWNEFGEDRTAIWSACQFLSNGAISKGRVRFTINPSIVNELSHPTLYAKVQLLVQSRLTKKHSLVLYEYFQDKLGRNRRMSNVPTVDLLNLLNLNTETYQQWKYFKRDVLTPAISEINKYTDLSVTFTGVRERNKTSAVDFIVERVPGFQLSLDINDTDKETPSLLEELMSRGVHEKSASKLLLRFDAERIEASIEAYDKERATDPDSIANSGGWISKAIEQNWHAKEEPAVPTEKQVSVLNPAKVEDMRSRYETVRSNQAWEAFENRHKSFQTRRKNAFAKSLENPGPGLRMVASAFASDGIMHPRVKGYFMNKKLINELLGEDFDTGFQRYKDEQQVAQKQ